MNIQIRSYRQRIHAKTRHLRDVLDAIDERTARADASTIAPRRTPTERVSNSGYADPTLNTVGERDQLLGVVELDLTETAAWAHRAASRLSLFAPNPPTADTCTCTPDCCPDGCHRPRTDGRDQHPTCRQRRARAARRGEPWALDQTAETR